MNIQRYEVYTEVGGRHEDESGEFVYYEDHIKVVESYIAGIAAAKVEIDKLMLSLKAWDEKFK